jgi:two-component sensor histidine kinase
MFKNGPSGGGKDERPLAQAIVDTLREPLVVLDHELRVIVASRSFYSKFRVERVATEGQLLSQLGAQQWNIQALLVLLERVAPDRFAIEDYEVALDLPGLGQRTFLLNANKLYYEDNHSTHVLLAFEDVTERRLLERHRDELLHQKDLLLQEMEHRIANSLSIIASILLLKARTVPSPETRLHLEDAHKRVMSVAEVQRHLHGSKAGQPIDIGHYLRELCASLASSMINGDHCKIVVGGAQGHATSAEAVSIGLIATELIINSLKHAFPESKPGCRIDVSYETHGSNWKLSIADNGVGKSEGAWPPASLGLGTSIVDSLARQLEARVDTKSGPTGTSVSITHSTFIPRP